MVNLSSTTPNHNTGTDLRKYANSFYIFCAIMLGYWLILPFFWPTPHVDVQIINPQLRQGENLQVKIVASAWHNNFYLRDVQFGGAWMLKSTMFSSEDLLQVTRPYTQTQNEDGWSRLTLKRTKTWNVEIPLQKIIGQEGMTPSPLDSRITVLIRHAKPIPRKYRPFNNNDWVLNIYHLDAHISY